MTDKRIILETAYSLFRKNGYANVSVNDICKECGITKPTFYKYIPSKENILSYYFEDVKKLFTGNIKGHNKNGNYWKAITYGFTVVLQRMKEFGTELYGELCAANIKNPQLSSYSFLENSTNGMIEVFELAKENKQILNPSSSYELYRACLYYCHGIALSWCITNGNINPIEEFIKGIELLCIVPEEFR